MQEKLEKINKAFNKLEERKTEFKKYYNMYMASYSEEAKKTLEERNLSNLYIPLVRNTVNTIVGQFNSAFFGNKNPIELRPALSDDTDKISGLNRLITYYYNLSIPQNELLKAIRNAFVYGFGCINIYWDKRRDMPITKCMPIDTIALDPKALNFRDNTMLARKEKVTKERLEEVFKKKFDTTHNNLLTYKELYEKKGDVYDVFCFVEEKLVATYQTSTFPFCYGYAYDRLLPSNREESNSLAYLGDCLPRILEPFQIEMNKKRNQKVEMDNLAMHPKVIYNGDFDPNIFSQGAGSSLQVSDLDAYRIISQGGNINIERDIMIIDKEANEASGITSIDMGRTSTSDRRSGTSLSFLAQSSSVRLEEAIATLNNTLFNNWAKSFVKLVNTHANPIIRQNLEAHEYIKDIHTRIKINFGSSMAVNQKIQNLMQIQQMLSQNPNVNPEFLLNINKEIIMLMGGDEYDTESMFGNSDKQAEELRMQGIL